MPGPLWLIESRGNHPTQVPQRLMYAVQELGMEVVPARYVPFRQEFDPSFLPADRPVIFYGSVGTVRCYSRLSAPAVRPFAWFDHEAMSCRGYYARWGPFLLQEDYAFYPFAELLRLRDRLYERHGEDGRLFVRPDANDKSFTGEVVDRGRFDAWHGLHREGGVAPDLLCVAARPARILAEYRLVVCDRRVVAASLYKKEGEAAMEEGCPEEVRSFAEAVAGSAEWQPAPIYCLDAAVTPSGPRVVEVGEVNCSDLYRCDLRAVAAAMAAVAEREWGR
jgi:hypothetical protein